LLLGAIIGFEQPWRQRMAGLRTNALVSLGAAGFVVFSTTVSGDNSPTQIIGGMSLEPFVTVADWQAKQAAAEG
jgi:uncharacterized membrane protein YhiD involved in acid resistance